ncbi:diheme cytochrome c [Candidatus Ferrigenium straubiae]|jgi:nitrate/TMAO reductase-like tetraheme cytochrome c subunit|uniref:diheme cytochrome c n=1 Tax=Candidatus Ferrigenium straubiae TaxID=2919506 RepID=UPI003F4A9985
MLNYYPELFRRLAVAALIMIGMMPAAQAEDEQDGALHGRFGEKRGNLAATVQANDNWKTECGSCHIAFEPGLLPTESWRKIMGSLDKHFGADATVPEQINAEISAFLANNSNNHWTEGTTPLRITETDWFKRRHGVRKIPARAWEDPEVKSRANCAACHLQMERSHFGIKQR